MPVYRVNVVQRLLNQGIMNVYYYDVNKDLDFEEVASVLTSFSAAYTDSQLLTSLSEDWALVGVQARNVSVPDMPVIEAALTTPLTGTSQLDPLPTQVALLGLGTANTQFPRRVRTYQAGLSEGPLGADGQFNEIIAGRMVAFLEAVDSIEALDAQLGRVSVRLEDTGDGPVVVASNRIQVYWVSRVPATQRRRRIGVGS